MPRTGQHGYFNISNSNYKSVIDPQRLEITGWNRASTTQSAVIDQRQHQPREERKATPQNRNITLSNLKTTEDVDSGVETGGPGMEQSNPGSERDTQRFRGSAQSPIPHVSIGSLKGVHFILTIHLLGEIQDPVPYIIPRAREGRFVSEALGRSGSGEWVCCA